MSEKPRIAAELAEAEGRASRRRLIAPLAAALVIDPDRTRAQAVTSSTTDWGAVLSDGSHWLGCSLYPTAEISAAERVTSDPTTTTKKAFSWAMNPISSGGETLWASGYLPGVRTITYRLPDETTVPATISSSGYWMVKGPDRDRLRHRGEHG